MSILGGANKYLSSCNIAPVVVTKRFIIISAVNRKAGWRGKEFAALVWHLGPSGFALTQSSEILCEALAHNQLLYKAEINLIKVNIRQNTIFFKAFSPLSNLTG